MILLSIISFISVLIVSLIIAFNVYFYLLLQKENKINNKIDTLYLNMFNKKTSKEEFGAMYRAIKRKIKESNKIFDKIECLTKYTFIKHD